MAMATLSTPSTRSQYTYDQFIQQAQRDGLLSEFSDADLALAQRNPDAGMSILSYKRDYRNATTDADRELANLGAEGVRRSYGSYTGGNDGSQYYLEPMSPNMFEYADAPSFSGGSHSDTVEDLYGQMLDYGDFEYGPAPEYTSRWDDTMVDLVGQILNNPEFSYDPATDQLYQNYKQQYTREGQRATADALGIAAAASGGLPSSYAQTAANQQANYYAAQLTDMIPQLYQLAYDRYLNDYNMMISDLGVVQGMEESDRDLYLTDLNQYNTDREFAYGQFLDEINDQTADFETLVGMAELGAQYGDYRGLENLGIQLPQVSVSGSGSGYLPAPSGEDEEDGGETGGVTTAQSQANANQLLNTINRIPGLTEENKISMIRDAYVNGQITLDDQNRLITEVGYSG